MPSKTLSHPIVEAVKANDDKALKCLQAVSKNQSSLYRQKAMWYLALIYIKQEKKAAVRDLLNSITDIPEAKELLNRISD
ncbi:hypothetical protein [Agriterribacter sp.]|uniref:hypothetical protein n=1 Tax=Agriterribacter sp. TaxID=2821509 RepID=UPI002D1FBA03|nr:hypothetical protein [Agriterribacter sp.]